jgi:hypothetical protein
MADNDIASGLRDKYFGRGKPSKAAPSGPEFRAREEKFPLLGATGRALKSVDEFARKPFGYSNPPAEIISDLMQIPALTRTIENINYGSPLTHGTSSVSQYLPKLNKDTAGAIEGAVNLVPFAGPLVRATKNMPIGMVVKPVGNLNLRPSVLASAFKGPEKQKVGDFIKQINGMKSLTKEGKAGALASLKAMDPDTVVTKQFIEDSFEPSRFGKIDLKGASDDLDAHLTQQAQDHAYGRDDLDELFSEYMGYDYDPNLGRKLNRIREATSPEAQLEALNDLPIGVREDFNRWGIIERDGSLNATQLDAYHDEMMNSVVDRELEYLRTNYEDYGDVGDYSYRDFQRLTHGDDDNYVEIGVSHPDAPANYKHYMNSPEPIVSHFRGSGDMSKARLFDETDTTFDLDPNSFVIEELQSDVQKGIKQEGPYHLPHATAFKAAVQHALEKGHDTVYLPTARTIAGVRGKGAESFAPIYDQEVVNYGLSPLTRMEGVTVEPVFGGEDIAYHKLKFSPEAKQELLEGQGFSLPGFAEGGSVDLRTRYFGPARQRSSKPDVDDLISRASTDFSTLLAGTMNPVNSSYERPTLPELQPTRFNTLPPIEMI